MNERANMSLVEMDRQSHFHPVTSIDDINTNGAQIYASGKGSTLTHADGRELLDFGAGLWCVNVGYGREDLVQAGAEAMRRLSFQHSFGSTTTEPTIRLADRLLNLFRDTVPESDMARVFFGNSGSDANDTAYKLVIHYNNLRGKPLKKKVISRIGAYHGITMASGSLTGIAGYHTAFDMPIKGVLHTSCPHYYTFHEERESEADFTARMISDLEALIAREGADTVAAFICEPVMGTGGVFTPPAGYFDQLQQVLDRHDILLIVDEVITGFGRTGQWFGCGTYGIRPDIVSLAKGLTSAYFPMSASIVSARIWDVLTQASAAAGPVMHGFTYSGHPVGAAIALANVDLIAREELVDRSATLGPVLLEALKAKVGDHPFVGDIRGQGLMVGVEYVADRATRAAFPKGTAPHKIVGKHATAEGVLTRALPFLHVNSFSPPLSVTESEIDIATDRFAAALRKATPEMEALLA